MRKEIKEEALKYIAYGSKEGGVVERAGEQMETLWPEHLESGGQQLVIARPSASARHCPWLQPLFCARI